MKPTSGENEAVPPPLLIFRTWGIDLKKARYGMPPRRHTLTARVLQTLTPVQLYNAHKGEAVAVMQAGTSEEEVRLMLVKMQRLHLEAVERLLKLAGDPYLLRIDQSPIEPHMLGKE